VGSKILTIALVLTSKFNKMRKLLSILSIFLFSFVISFGQSDEIVSNSKSTFTDSLELNVNVKFNTSELEVKNQIKADTQFKEYLGKSIKNDSVFLEEIKKISSDIIPLLQNAKFPNMEALQFYNYDKEKIYNAILKENRINNIAKYATIIGIILLFLMEAAAYSGPRTISHRQKLEFFVELAIFGLIIYFGTVFIGNSIFNSDIYNIKSILEYSR
jgi:hypothetical protein